jgi:hypothetical protein
VTGSYEYKSYEPASPIICGVAGEFPNEFLKVGCSLCCLCVKGKGKDIPVTGRGGP